MYDSKVGFGDLEEAAGTEDELSSAKRECGLDEDVSND